MPVHYSVIKEFRNQEEEEAVFPSNEQAYWPYHQGTSSDSRSAVVVNLFPLSPQRDLTYSRSLPMGIESTISIPTPTEVFIMVDDTDPDVVYDGPWSQDLGTTDSDGSAGSTYNHTTHVIRDNGSLSFTFTGTQFTAAASMTIRNVDAQNDPNWTCSVDGFSLATGGNNGIDDTNRYILCSNSSLALGQHTVSIDVQSLGTPFWFDYIHYLPGPTVSNDSSIIIYDSLNANVQYDGTWVNSPNSGAHMTQKNGGTLSVPFNGTSISWIGFALQSLPEAAAQAKYSLDLGPDVQFSIPTITPAEDSSEFQQTYFITPPVQNGPHTLTVTYEGNDQTTPLMLDYFLVSTGPKILDNSLGSNNASVAAISSVAPTGTLSSTGSGPSQMQPGNPNSNSANSNPAQNTKVVTNVGAIVGGVVGGAAFALLVALGSFFIWKWRRAKHPRDEVTYYGVPRRSPDMIVSTNDRVSMLHVEPWDFNQEQPRQHTEVTSIISAVAGPPTLSTTTSSAPSSLGVMGETHSRGYITAVGSKAAPPRYSP